MSLIKFIISCSFKVKLLKLSPLLILSILKCGIKNHLLFSIFDLIGTLAFIENYKKHKPKFSIIFLNSLAHTQHHHWTSGNKLSKELITCMRLIDTCIGEILGATNKDCPLIITNGYSQKNTINEDKYLYRQRDPYKLLIDSGINAKEVNQLMTNDAFILFDKNTDLLEAKNILERATINNMRIFDVGLISNHPLKLFYQLIHWPLIGGDEMIVINGRKLKFYSYFQSLGRYSGSHAPEGCIYSRGIKLKENMINYEIFDSILSSYEEPKPD